MSLVVVGLKDFSFNLVSEVFNGSLLAIFRYYKNKGRLRFPDNRLMQPYPLGLRIIKKTSFTEAILLQED